MALGHYIGPHLSKYAQTTQDKVDLHTYPSGTTVAKAFVASNVVLYDNKNASSRNLTKHPWISFFSKDHLVDTKNRQNNQAITLTADTANPAICPVHSVMQLVLCAYWLQQPNDIHVGFYKTKKGLAFYLTGNKIAELLRKEVWKVCPDTTPDNLKKYSAHLLCVWACVLLNEAGKTPEYFEEWFCWLDDSFRMYLRDTTIIQN